MTEMARAASWEGDPAEMVLAGVQNSFGNSNSCNEPQAIRSYAVNSNLLVVAVYRGLTLNNGGQQHG